jgi:GT2 family glycosyltransferase/SAM-dependent methyltransferase
MSKKPDSDRSDAPTASSEERAAAPLLQKAEGAPFSVALAQGDSRASFSGERFLPGLSGEIALEHLHRYLYAAYLASGAEVLDVACGEGYGSSMLAQHARRVVGVDIDRGTIERARAKYTADNLNFVEGSCTALPAASGSIDLVVSFETIEHIREQEAFLAEVRRVLRPGGTLVISSPERGFYNRYRATPNEFHVRELSRDEFVALLERTFAHVRTGSQRNVFGSTITGRCLDSEWLTIAATAEAATRVVELPAGPYVIAVCSDRDLPPLPASLFEGAVAPYLVSALQGGIVERDEKLAKMRAALDASAHEHEKLRALEGHMAKKDAVITELRNKCEEEQAVARDNEARAVDFRNRTVELQEELRRLKARVADEPAARAVQPVKESQENTPQAGCSRPCFCAELRATLRQSVSRYWRAGIPLLKRLPRPLSRLGWGREYDAVQHSRLFDAGFYLDQNADVAAADRDPVWHYLEFGGKEGRVPSPHFDGKGYLMRNADVAASGMNPLVHYLLFGEGEKRSPIAWFDFDFYLSWNPEGRRNPRGAYSDYLENWQPRPRRSFSEGEMSSLVKAINARAASCAMLRSEAAENPEISVVVPVHGELRITLRCLLSLVTESARVPFEIIVVDDCSKDETPDVVPCLTRVRYLRCDRNAGFIASSNRGAEAARGRYLVFLNNDTCVLPNWLDELHGTFAIRPKAGLVGSQLIYPDGRLQEAGCIVWRDGSGWNYGRGEDRRRPEFNYLREVDYCSGASIMIPRDLFRRFGGFDALYCPAYAEDCDLAFKVREAGYEVLYQPLSRVVHFEGVSSGTDITHGVKAYQVENCRKFQERWKSETAAYRAPGQSPELERERKVQRRALFIDACTPAPDSDAGSVVLWHTLKIFRDLGYGVSFIPADNLLYAERYTDDLQREGVECLYFPYLKSVDEYLKRCGAKLDVVVLYRCPIAARHIDAVRRLAPRAKVLFNTVDLHFLREQRQAELAGSQAMMKQAAERREQELAIMRKADATVLLNTKEQELIARLLPDVKTYMLPLIQDIPGSRIGYADRSDIVFVGGFNHPPNLDAVKYFSAEILPRVRAKLPGVKFVIVGSNAPDGLAERVGEGVEIRGFVPNLADVFDRYRISVAPLRVGAGMKGKIVASLSYGVPCVTTSIGSEGMGLTNGQNILVADDPGAFAEAVVSLYRHPAQWQLLSEAGVRFARRELRAGCGAGKNSGDARRARVKQR